MRRRDHGVTKMPPPWRRSLTESGMRSLPTRADQIVVALFAVALLAFGIWLVATQA
jgi:hypothetical protein